MTSEWEHGACIWHPHKCATSPQKKPTQIILRKDPPKEYCPWRKITKHGSAVDSHDDILVKEKKKKKTPMAKEELSISISLMHIIDIKNFGTKILSLLSSAWPYIIYVKFYFKFVNNLTVQYYCLIQIVTLLIGVIALQKYRPIPSLVKIQNIDKNIDL